MAQDYFINESIFLEDVYMRKNLTVTGILCAANISFPGLDALSGNWQNTYLTVSALSANWNIDNAYDLAVRALTANWQNTFTTVNVFSGGWGVDNAFDLAVRALTGNWQNTFTTVNTYSASWDIDNAYDLAVRALTGDWQNTFTTVNTYSASWDIDNAYDLAVRALTANWENTYTTVSSFSANWNIDNSIDTEVRALSANWQNTYTTVSSFSASWGNNASKPLTAVDVFIHVNSNFFALPEHSGKILHFDTTVGPLTAFFNEPLPDGFNLGIVVRANNPVTIKSSNSTILSQGDTLLFFLDKALVYKEPVSNSLIALGDLV